MINSFKACLLNVANDGKEYGKIRCFRNDSSFSVCPALLQLSLKVLG